MKLALYVLDASAIIAVLRDERGADFIAPHLAGGIVSTVNIQEVVKALLWQGVSITLAKAMISKLQLDIVSHTQEDAYLAAALVPLTAKYGSGLGDRTCMALAISKGVPVVTTDRAWANLEIAGLEVILAR